MGSAFVDARTSARELAADAQERNRLWWEAMPMTYESWEQDDRVPHGHDAFDRIDRRFLDGNPWLRTRFDFAAARGRRVLEIGCGAGSASCLFAAAGAEVVAVDLTQQAVELTRANARAKALELDVRRMDAESLQFPAESFDYVFSWGVIHHSRSTETVMREIARVLRPGGRGLCMVYNRASVRYYLHGLFWLFAKGKILAGHDLASVQGCYTDGYYQRHFTPRELRTSLGAAGLRCDRISITHMANRMLPALPRRVDELLKRKAGWLLVGEFEKTLHTR
jgi:2-polyprenyl-3-methyl-5-hydroxy-6-metoxy-1,4-benzoquinol methylase